MEAEKSKMAMYTLEGGVGDGRAKWAARLSRRGAQGECVVVGERKARMRQKSSTLTQTKY